MIESINTYYSLNDIPNGFLKSNINNKNKDDINDIFLLILVLLIMDNDKSILDNNILTSLMEIFLN
ncbi:hypothetical protein [Vallitalea guaymasensis]|uniref:Uncharacterized protein n=1 Tax=Vallitalea guaymasensis TaxID=1185412 RepID=A0A8J8M6Y6_9FIRM|nr:hypothetical protein [Vallitalea guaymasensis]QUH27471.1 hypothetical protein HYG85_00450 [Vallitalea guaymasensis]